MKATLRIEPLPNARPGDKLVTIDCKHGTTEAYVCIGDVPVPDGLLVAACLRRHHLEQPTCRCCRDIERRYGLAA